MNKKRNLRIGLVFAGTLVVFVLGLNFLKGRGVFSGDKRYFINYENINGLIETSPVLYNGFKVGVVSDIGINFDNKKMVVAIDVRNDLMLGDSCIANIVSTDFLGSKAIRLENVGTSSIQSDSLIGRLELDLVSELNKKLAPLQKNIETLVKETNVTMKALNGILTEETQNNIKASISNLNEITSNISSLTQKNQSNVNKMMRNGALLSDSLVVTMSEVNGMVKNMNEISVKLNESGLDTMVQNLQLITTQIKSGDGSLGKMIYDDTMYTQLNSTMAGVNVLVTDFKNNPERYIHIDGVNFGKKNFFVDPDSFVLKSKVQLFVLVNEKDIVGSKGDVLSGYTPWSHKKDQYLRSVSFTDFSLAKKELVHVQSICPAAKIVAFKKDKMISLDKAFKH
ncbi:MlaD family protein [Halosquirtibacter xylanolyticus]|uniref:MlaD family protein n=1 Tax=Halosquirtibacter xylanolyticus TaxID=3374599 RepID=UPI0037484BD7|nr:MlaD family protein [Prolixibacteraceae bacterium]